MWSYLLRSNARRLLIGSGARIISVVGGGTTVAGISFFKGGGDSSKKREDPFKTGIATGLSRVIQEADSYYEAYMIDNAYSTLNRHRDSSDPEVLWRLARVLCEKAKLSRDQKEKRELFYEALEFAKKALNTRSETVHDRCFGAHKWYAIILDYVGELEGTKSRLLKAYEVKDHLERAVEINPLDATTWHILGIWHFSFADLSSVSRLAAKALFATPPSSTYDEALRHFEKAEAIQPNFYSANDYYMGMTHERLGRKEEAIKFFKKAFAAPVISVDDGETHKKQAQFKAYDQLKKLGAAYM